MKSDAHKIRRLHGGKVLVGFAGASADAFALLERFEAKLKDFQGSVPRAATELAKDWRMDRALRRLEAMMIAVDQENLLLVSGTGDVIQPTDGVAAIGSGGPYALAAWSGPSPAIQAVRLGNRAWPEQYADEATTIKLLLHDAMHDTRKFALDEARRAALRPFLLTVDQRGADYLREMCGAANYEVLSDVERLPERGLPCTVNWLPADKKWHPVESSGRPNLLTSSSFT